QQRGNDPAVADNGDALTGMCGDDTSHTCTQSLVQLRHRLGARDDVPALFRAHPQGERMSRGNIPAQYMPLPFAEVHLPQSVLDVHAQPEACLQWGAVWAVRRSAVT